MPELVMPTALWPRPRMWPSSRSLTIGNNEPAAHRITTSQTRRGAAAQSRPINAPSSNTTFASRVNDMPGTRLDSLLVAEGVEKVGADRIFATMVPADCA